MCSVRWQRDWLWTRKVCVAFLLESSGALWHLGLREDGGRVILTGCWSQELDRRTSDSWGEGRHASQWLNPSVQFWSHTSPGPCLPLTSQYSRPKLACVCRSSGTLTSVLYLCVCVWTRRLCKIYHCEGKYEKHRCLGNSVFHLCVSCTTYTEHFTSDTSGDQVWGGFSHQQAVLRHQLGVLQFNSILTLSTWDQNAQVIGSVLQDWQTLNIEFSL